MGAPEPLRRDHRVEDFSSGKTSLDDWLKRHALQAQGSGSARTFVVTEGHRIAGFYSLTVGQVEIGEAPERVAQGMGRYPIPVVILARLAVALTDQGRGLGRDLLQDAIARILNLAEEVGIRALLTHPIDDDAERFYRRFGFQASPLRDRQLLLLLKDARKVLASK